VVKKGEEMSIVCKNEDLATQDLLSFLKENDFKGLKLRLLLFWTRHPQTKFNLDCIAHVLDTTRHHLHGVLGELIDKGMIREQYCPSGIAHYSLNHEHAINEYILELSKLDWSIIKNLEGELESEAVPV